VDRRHFLFAYLWHWPLLILTSFALGVAKLTLAHRIILLGVSLGISTISKRQVEDRFRFPRSAQKHEIRSLRNVPVLAIYLLMSVGLASCAYFGARFVEVKTIKVAKQLYGLSLNPDPCFGARATEPGASCPNSHLLADRDFALENWKTQINQLPNGRYCQNGLGDPTLAPCGFGAPENATRRQIAVLGDSHVGVWESALATFVVAQGIRIRSFVASARSPPMTARWRLICFQSIAMAAETGGGRL
jgi:hypothetical protein